MALAFAQRREGRLYGGDDRKHVDAVGFDDVVIFGVSQPLKRVDRRRVKDKRVDVAEGQEAGSVQQEPVEGLHHVSDYRMVPAVLIAEGGRERFEYVVCNFPEASQSVNEDSANSYLTP